MDLKDKFVKVYDSCADGVFRYCFFRVHDREVAKDIVQESFMKTWEQIAQGVDIKNVKSFVYKVARNLIVDRSRKKSEISLDKMVDSGFAPSLNARIEDKVDAKLLVSALEKLEDKYKEVVVLRYLEGFKPSEIAEILGETPNIVSIRITRGIKKVRKELEKY